MANRTYSSEDLSSGSPTVRSSDGKEQSLRDKANLVVQHFFTKAALIICSSRVSLPPAMSKTGEAKIDRWVRILSSVPLSCKLAVYSLDHRSTPYC
jgi:autophagy-related protein 13